MADTRKRPPLPAPYAQITRFGDDVTDVFSATELHAYSDAENAALRAEVERLREDAERYRALKERHGYIMVVRLINADGYSSAEKDALIDAFADAAIADIAAWESLSEAQKALQLDAQAKRAEINAARKGEA